MTRRRALANDPVAAMLGVCLLTTLVFIVLWADAVYRVRRDIALLRVQFAAHEHDRSAVDASVRAELDRIYQTLYAPVDTPAATEPRQPSSVELWQRNRDKELRDRLMRLEQWRLRMER